MDNTIELQDKANAISQIANLITSKECFNVGIFADFDNIYYGLRDFAINYDDGNCDIFNLMNEIYGKDRIRTMRAYADFDQVKVNFRKLQEQRVQIRNVYGNGKEEKSRKNASDIELCIDAIENYYSNKDIETYVFITSDSDMIPIMSRMIYKGKKVHLYNIKDNTSSTQDMTSYCHIYADLTKLFSIDTNIRTNPNTYTIDATTIIKKWFDRNRNKPNLKLGAPWLNSELQDNLYMSSKLAGKVIEDLKTKKIISEMQDTTIGKYFVLV